MAVPDGLASESHRILSLSWSPDGTLLAGGLYVDEIVIWDTASGQHIQTLFADAGGISQLVWTPDGKRLAAAYGNGSVRVWDPVTGDLLLTFTGGGNEDFDRRSCCVIAWTAEGRLAGVQWPYFFDRSEDGEDTVEALVWDVETGEQVVSLENPSTEDRMDWGSVFSADGASVAGNIGDGDFGVWDVETGERIEVLNGPTVTEAADTKVVQSPAALLSAFSPDWDMTAIVPSYVTLGEPIIVSLWDLETGELLLAFDPVNVTW